MVERCADCGFDLAAGLVEVVPTAHYMMGRRRVHGRLPHRARGPVRGRRGHGRRARRQPARWKRGSQFHGLRRDRGRCDGRLDRAPRGVARA
jgi:hypothetical protein